MYATTTRPPGRVTRTSSSANRQGAGTCSTTLEEKQTSTDRSATGSRSPRPATAGRVRQLGRVGVEGDVPSAGGGERLGELHRPGTDVQDDPAGE